MASTLLRHFRDEQSIQTKSTWYKQNYEGILKHINPCHKRALFTQLRSSFSKSPGAAMGYFCISKQCGTIAAAHNSCIPSILVGNLVMWTGCSRSVHAVTLSTVVVVLERTLIHLKGIELVCANCSAGQTKTHRAPPQMLVLTLLTLTLQIPLGSDMKINFARHRTRIRWWQDRIIPKFVSYTLPLNLIFSSLRYL